MNATKIKQYKRITFLPIILLQDRYIQVTTLQPKLQPQTNLKVLKHQNLKFSSISYNIFSILCHISTKIQLLTHGKRTEERRSLITKCRWISKSRASGERDQMHEEDTKGVAREPRRSLWSWSATKQLTFMLEAR